MEFEERLAAAQAVKPGHGILIFCGTGFTWHKSNLEDFADFYLTGTHRGDRPFALMEQHHIKEEEINLRRNIGHFAFLHRHIEKPETEELHFPIRGPIEVIVAKTVRNHALQIAAFNFRTTI
jgi:hypothetical protein